MIKAMATITLVQNVDITAYYRFYKLQPSTAAVPAKPATIATLPPSGWSDTEPGYTENSTNSLYFVDLTTFSDGDFRYSNVSLSSSYEAAKSAYNQAAIARNAVDNMMIGGRNLMVNTLNPDVSSPDKRPKMLGQEVITTVSSGTVTTAKHGFRLTSTSAARPCMYFGYHASDPYGLNGFVLGETYTFSFDASWKTMSNYTGAGTSYMRVYLFDDKDTTGTPASDVYATFDTLTTGKFGVERSGRCEFTFTIPENVTKAYLCIRCSNSTAANYASGDYLELRNIKLEKGNKATDWTPAPEDLETEITDFGTALQTSIDNVSVGGRNLLLDSNAPTLTKRAAAANRYWSDSSVTTVVPEFAEVTDAPFNITTVARFTCSGTSSQKRAMCFYVGATDANPKLIDGEEYTISVLARLVSGSIGSIRITYGNSPYKQVNEYDITSTEWKMLSASFIYDAAGSNSGASNNGFGPRIYFYALDIADSAYVMEMCGFKLEKGNKATDWTSAPEDDDYNVQALGTSLQAQIDSKIQTWYQASTSDPSTGWTADEKVAHTGDLWYKTDLNTTWRYTGSTWVEQSIAVPQSVWDKIDGKSAIYYGDPNDAEHPITGMEVGDYLIDNSDGTAGRSYRWDGTNWVTVTDYAVAIQNGIDSVEIGGRNLILDTGAVYQSGVNPSQPDYIATLRQTEHGKSVLNDTETDFVASFEFETYGDFSEYTSTPYFYIQINGASTSPANQLYITEATSGKYISKFKLTAAQAASTAGTARVRLRYIPAGCSYKIWNFKLEKGNKPTDWTPAPEDTEAQIAEAAANAVEYIVGTQTESTGAWTGVTKESALNAGKTIAYKLPYAGSGNATLELTLADGTTTGAKPVYTNTTRVTTHFGVNSVITMTYDGSNWRAAGAAPSNSNTYDRTQYKANVTAAGAIAAGRIGVFNSAGKLILLSTTSFDITCPILYIGTAYTADDLTQTNNYTMYGAPFNLANTKSGFSGTAGKPVYIVGTLDGKMFTPDSAIFTTTVPTTEDGKAYMLFGLMSTTTNAVLNAEHPIYRFRNGKFQSSMQMANNAYEAAEEAGEAATEAARTATNYLSFDSTNGLVISEEGTEFQTSSEDDLLDDGSSDVYNVQVKGNGINLRLGATVLMNITGSSITMSRASTGLPAMELNDSRLRFYRSNGTDIAMNLTDSSLSFYGAGANVSNVVAYIGSTGLAVERGTIGDFTVSDTGAANATTANGGHVYARSLYCHYTGDSTYDYEFGIHGNNTGQTNNSVVFYVSQLAKNGVWANASMVTSLKMDGTFTTTKANIGSWTVNSSSIAGNGITMTAGNSSSGIVSSITMGKYTNSNGNVVRTTAYVTGDGYFSGKYGAFDVICCGDDPYSLTDGTSSVWYSLYASKGLVSINKPLTVEGTATIKGKTTFKNGVVLDYSLSNGASNAYTLVLGTDGKTIAKGAASSRRYKDIDRPLTSADVEKAYNIRVYRAKYKKGYLMEGDRMEGVFMPMLIAEEVAEAIPEAASFNREGEAEDWNYRVMIPVMFQMIKELRKEIKQLMEIPDRTS